MKKINTQTIIQQYQSGIENYEAFTREVGLWESEKYVFEKYLQISDEILDLGCGTGRTTFPLHALGYKQIQGLDLTPEMIGAAKKLNTHFNKNILFEIGDATNLTFADASFDTVIFSFNGIMSIPQAANRNKAVQEINRVLKTHGIFIFTTHDRNKDADYFEFWKKEVTVWAEGKQNPTLYEFGDLYVPSKNETRTVYIHIPDEAEVMELMEANGFAVLETFYRSDKFDEPEKVKEKSGECRFWIAMKKA